MRDHPPDGVIDDYGVRVLQKACQLHGYFSKPHTSAAKDLNNGVGHKSHAKSLHPFLNTIMRKKQLTYEMKQLLKRALQTRMLLLNM